MTSSTNTLQTRGRRLSELMGKVAALLAVVVAILMLVVFLVIALQWQTQPYLGVRLSPNMAVANAYSLSASQSPAEEVGLVVGDQLIAVGGETFAPEYRVSQEQLTGVLAEYAPGDRIRVRFERSAEGEPPSQQMQCVSDEGQLLCAAIFELTTFPLVDFLVQFIVPWIVGIGGTALAIYILARRWNQGLARMVAFYSALLAVTSASIFDLYTLRLIGPFVVSNCMILLTGLLVMFILSFPSYLVIVQRFPWLRLIPSILTIAGLAFINLLLQADTITYDPTLMLAMGVAVIALSLKLAMTLRRVGLAISPVVRDQGTIVAVSMALAVVPIVVWFVSFNIVTSLLGQTIGFHFALVTPFLLLLPLGMIYALSQDVLPQSDTLITSSIVYSVMGIAIVLGYTLLVAGISLLTGSVIQGFNPLVIAITLFFVALIFVPLRTRLEQRVHRSYFRTHRLYQDRIESLSQDMTQFTSLVDIVEVIRSNLNVTLGPTHSFIFFLDEEIEQYIAFGVPVPETDVRFDVRSPLIGMLQRQLRPFYMEPGVPLLPELATERARLAVLGAHVLVPIRGRDRLNGMLAVGPRQIGERYHYDDLTFLQTITDQAALAVERAQVIDNLERRVREMNVLGQVSQAVNFTVEFDDLLELVYAQTNRIIAAPNFYIVLRDANTDELYYALCSEGDERVTEREGVRWRIGRDLISDIVRGGQPVRVENYGSELTRRGVDNWMDNLNLKAWMGVPLNAPTAVLGVMCIGSTAMSVSYTDEQLKILWQIADQAAIALDKARLFQETEIRARQLTALNEISTQLATVFQDSERLLELITESAVRILQSEAGSLLMVDPETRELEFKVAVGKGSDNLVGTRLPPGTGLVGTVADRAEPVMVNDTMRDPRWYSDVDVDTMVETSTLMAAPLMGNTGVIGVLEVINKVDGGVFVEEDKRLLTTFAGQAAISIENARLFQMTDQQLAARVDELDTMQKIDRELNATLQLQRVLDITLDWALRESGANAGAIGMVLVDPPSLQMVAHYGYGEESLMDKPWDISKGIVGRVVRAGQPELVADVSHDADYVEAAPGIQSQMTVPLFTGGQVGGVIILESTDRNRFSLLDLDFMSRLAEHASPALSNANLFAQLENANEARSEFVSFVAHEIKTPMTSIKGFADLLLGGVVGPLNDQQKNFLGTIRMNVNRMDTLVSDLNDLTKLQTANMQMDMSPVSFASIVEETLRPLANQIEEKQQQVIRDIPGNLPQIYADKNRLVQVLTNLLTNANKYTPEAGKIIVHAEVSRNMWDPAGAAEVLHFSIQDDGFGISDEDQTNLFTAYFRSTNDEALEQPGTGLGLVIVRGIVEQHGGQIWVESSLGSGSTFHATVPLASAVPAAAG